MGGAESARLTGHRLPPASLPSYKLWYRYLKARRAQVKHRCVTDPAYEDVNNCHERAFVFMHKVGRAGRGTWWGGLGPRQWAGWGDPSPAPLVDLPSS